MPSVNRGSQHISLYFSFLVFIFGMLNSVIFFFFVFIQKLLCCCCCCWNLFFKRTDWQIVIYWQFQVDDVITTTTHLDRLKSCFILTIFLLLFFCLIFFFFFFLIFHRVLWWHWWWLCRCCCCVSENHCSVTWTNSTVFCMTESKLILCFLLLLGCLFSRWLSADDRGMADDWTHIARVEINEWMMEMLKKCPNVVLILYNFWKNFFSGFCFCFC